MKRSLILLALATVAIHVQATNGTHTEGFPVSSNSDSSANNKSSSSAVNGSLYGGESNYYAIGFPQPSRAANLPPGLCPKGDSLAWSVGWSFITYATSSTRTEMDCLEKIVGWMRQTRPVDSALPSTDKLHPTCAVRSTPTQNNFVKKPARKCT